MQLKQIPSLRLQSFIPSPYCLQGKTKKIIHTYRCVQMWFANLLVWPEAPHPLQTLVMQYRHDASTHFLLSWITRVWVLLAHLRACLWPGTAITPYHPPLARWSSNGWTFSCSSSWVSIRLTGASVRAHQTRSLYIYIYRERAHAYPERANFCCQRAPSWRPLLRIPSENSSEDPFFSLKPKRCVAWPVHLSFFSVSLKVPTRLYLASRLGRRLLSRFRVNFLVRFASNPLF